MLVYNLTGEKGKHRGRSNVEKLNITKTKTLTNVLNKVNTRRLIILYIIVKEIKDCLCNGKKKKKGSLSITTLPKKKRSNVRPCFNNRLSKSFRFKNRSTAMCKHGS